MVDCLRTTTIQANHTLFGIATQEVRLSDDKPLQQVNITFDNSFANVRRLRLLKCTNVMQPTADRVETTSVSWTTGVRRHTSTSVADIDTSTTLAAVYKQATELDDSVVVTKAPTDVTSGGALLCVATLALVATGTLHF